MLRFAALRTPPGDGDVLVEPPLPALPDLVRANRSHLANLPGGIAGFGWADLRRQARAALGVHGDTPLILTGHQPEFMHAGVWAKYAAAHELAAAVGGAARNLVVDNDAPKTLALTIPVVVGDDIVLHHLPCLERGVGWPYESLPAASPGIFAQIRDKVVRLLNAQYPISAMPAFLDGFGDPAARDFVDQMAGGRRSVDRLLGLAVEDARVSRLCTGPMLVDWVLRAAELAAAYNRALTEYRQEHRVRSPNRPIPDLRIDGTRVELPLWAYAGGETRHRLYVEHAAGDVRFFADREFVGTVSRRELESAADEPDVLRAACRKSIRPRALTLMLWARLLASDLFIHGIGGAKYDRITNEIMRSYYGVEPPAMACVSATLRLPLPFKSIHDAEWTGVRRWIRDVQYQPDRWASGIPEAAPLLAERRTAIARSEGLRTDPARRHDRLARRACFDVIRDRNARIVALRPETLREARAALTAMETRRHQERLAASREYFFALFPRERLHALRGGLA